MEQEHIIAKRSATLTQEELQTTETMLNMLEVSLILSQELLSKSPHTDRSQGVSAPFYEKLLC